jgi:hypothetical protein
MSLNSSYLKLDVSINFMGEGGSHFFSSGELSDSCNCTPSRAWNTSTVLKDVTQNEPCNELKPK